MKHHLRLQPPIMYSIEIVKTAPNGDLTNRFFEGCWTVGETPINSVFLLKLHKLMSDWVGSPHKKSSCRTQKIIELHLAPRHRRGVP